MTTHNSVSDKTDKHIIVICPYPLDTAPGQRLKYEQYLSFLNRSGYRITILPFFSIRTYRILYNKENFWKKVAGVVAGLLRRFYQIRQISKADGIYVFLNVVPIGPLLFEKIYVRLAKHVIYDIDDMVHHLETSPQNRLVRFFRSDRRYFYLMRNADHVITCTPELDRIVKLYNPKTTDISSTVNTETYLPINKYKNDKRLVIGWSGSHSTSKYLYLLSSVFERLACDFHFKVLVMGAEKFSIPGIDVETVSWSPEIEIQTLQRIDIGVYPLPNNEWVKGKSGLKAIQYMSLGIPVVASHVGCNDRVIEDGVSGVLVNSDDEWYDALKMLILEPNLRAHLGKNARMRVEKLFSVGANQDKYLNIFKSVYG